MRTHLVNDPDRDGGAHCLAEEPFLVQTSAFALVGRALSGGGDTETRTWQQAYNVWVVDTKSGGGDERRDGGFARNVGVGDDRVTVHQWEVSNFRSRRWTTGGG
jgi:hypothetical protein